MDRPLYCPRRCSERLGRLPPNDVSPYPGSRCGGCGRRLRDRGSLPLYLFVLLVGLGFAAGVAGNLDRGGTNWVAPRS